MLTLHERTIEALRGIFDPEIPVNIYDLGLIYDLSVDETQHRIEIKMTLTSPACPVAQTFPQLVQDQLLKIPAVEQVSVELVWDPPWTQENLSEAAKLTMNLL